MPNKSTLQPAKPDHKKDLLLLFAFPIGISILAALVIYVPQLLANPSYDFIYSYCDDYACKETYTTDSSGNILIDYNLRSTYSSSSAKLGYYDSATGSTKVISYTDAQAYSLNTSSVSPEGYKLQQSSGSSGGFIFGGGSDSSWHLESGLMKKKVDFSASNSYYSNKVTFLGWVKK